MSFNPRAADETAALDEGLAFAISRATSPGQQSFGNAASIGGASTNLTIATSPVVGPVFPPVYPDEIGIDEEGVYWYPFHLGVDTFEDEGAYLPTGYATKDYGN